MQIIFIILGSLILLGILYEQYSRYKTKKLYPIKGEFVDVGGHQLHYVKKGSGDATIIFESGADFGGHVIWKNIQDKLSENFSTLSYDRSGILHSERGNNPKDSESMAQELHTMLEKLDLPKPYIFVGHSLAGITLRYFIKKYPKDVAGAILLDPSHPEMIEHLPKKIQKTLTLSPPRWLLSLLMHTGIPRIIFSKIIEVSVTNAHASAKKNYKEALANIHKGFNSGYADEYLNLEQLLNETKGIEFDTIPIILLGATKVPMDKKEYYETIEIMTTLHHKTLEHSLNGKYIDIDSGHIIQAEKPDLVIEVVEEFAKEVLKK